MNNGPEWMKDEQQSGLARTGATEPARDAEETAPGSVESAGAEGVYLHPGERMGSPAENVVVMEMDPEFATLERELSTGLQPFELPSGFADRVVAAAEDAKRNRPIGKVVPFRSVFRAWRVAAAGAIAASVLAGSFVADEIHQRRERERAALTEQEFETAVQVSNRALDQARAQLQRAAFRMER